MNGGEASVSGRLGLSTTGDGLGISVNHDRSESRILTDDGRDRETIFKGKM